MNEESNYQSTNINALWLQNIYENLKNLEILERLAREGCNSVFEYAQLPLDKKEIILADIQYKNLKFIVTEFNLLMVDSSPVIKPDDKTKFDEIQKCLDKINKTLNIRKLFLKESYSALRSGVSASSTTDFFNYTLAFIMGLRRDLIQLISHLLYVQETSQTKSW